MQIIWYYRLYIIYYINNIILYNRYYFSNYMIIKIIMNFI